MQLERSEVAFFIYTNGSRLRFNLTQRYFITDQTLMNMTTWPLASVPRDESKTQTYDVVNKAAFQARLDDFRQVFLHIIYFYKILKIVRDKNKIVSDIKASSVLVPLTLVNNIDFNVLGFTTA